MKALALVLISFLGVLALNRPSNNLIEFKPQIVPPKDLVHFTLGYRIVLADGFWLRILQADDFCETGKEKANFNPGLRLDDVLKAELPPSRCNKGWVYQMLDLTTDLYPKFWRAHRAGGLLLSLAVDDREGARLFFEKSVQAFPDDWQILYRAAYHYIFEIQDSKRAAELLEKVVRYPDVPPVVHLLAARLLDKNGKAMLAINVLEDYLKTVDPNSTAYSATKKRIEDLKASLDKK